MALSPQSWDLTIIPIIEVGTRMSCDKIIFLPFIANIIKWCQILKIATSSSESALEYIQSYKIQNLWKVLQTNLNISLVASGSSWFAKGWHYRLKTNCDMQGGHNAFRQWSATLSQVRLQLRISVSRVTGSITYMFMPWVLYKMASIDRRTGFVQLLISYHSCVKY